MLRNRFIFHTTSLFKSSRFFSITPLCTNSTNNNATSSKPSIDIPRPATSSNNNTTAAAGEDTSTERMEQILENMIRQQEQEQKQDQVDAQENKTINTIFQVILVAIAALFAMARIRDSYQLEATREMLVETTEMYQQELQKLKSSGVQQKESSAKVTAPQQQTVKII